MTCLPWAYDLPASHGLEFTREFALTNAMLSTVGGGGGGGGGYSRVPIPISVGRDVSRVPIPLSVGRGVLTGAHPHICRQGCTHGCPSPYL